MHDTNGTFGNGVVPVAHGLDDLVQVAQRGHLVSQLGLCAEQAHGCRGDGFQRLPLQKVKASREGSSVKPQTDATAGTAPTCAAVAFSKGGLFDADI